MSARLPRRSFAAPFVVTLAAVPACYVQSQTTTASSPPPGPATATTEPRDHRHTEPAPPPNEPRDHRHDQPAPAQPSQPTGNVAIANPPRPTQPAPTQPAPVGGTVIANPPRPTTQPAPTKPPVKPGPNAPRPSTQPTPAVVPAGTQPTGTAPNPPPPSPMRNWTVRRTKGQCKAYVDVKCPEGKPGEARPTCNPPPPVAYACPDSLADGETLKIVKPAGSSVCQVDYGPMTCPPNATCNPPRPRAIACPK